MSGETLPPFVAAGETRHTPTERRQKREKEVRKKLSPGGDGVKKKEKSRISLSVTVRWEQEMKKHLKVQNESRKPSEQETFQRTSRGVVCGIHRKRDNKTGEGEIYLFIFYI